MSKAKKLYIFMIVSTIISIILFTVSAIMGEFWDTYIPTIVTFCVMMILLILTIVIYVRYIKFVCPKCNQVFKPTASAIIWSMHTPTKRLLKCPHCNTKSWCKEHFE